MKNIIKELQYLIYDYNPQNYEIILDKLNYIEEKYETMCKYYGSIKGKNEALEFENRALKNKIIELEERD